MSNKRSMSLANNNPSHVVCVGASAGGLEALIALFKSLPKNTTAAFVVIQHLQPQHKSQLSEILSRETSLNVREAKNNTKVEPAHVYAIPSNTAMSISKGRLKIGGRIKSVGGQYLPINYFMTSLAKDQKQKAIGIILSGTGSDGTIGAKAIKDEGGLVFAQNEDTAHYFGMPESVINSHVANYVLAPKQMGQKLTHLTTHGYSNHPKSNTKIFDKQSDLNRILILLRDLTGVDFIHYKQTTIGRRIARRMMFHKIKNHVDYYKYLKKNPAEADILRKDILIPVTFFFRDPKLFAVLRKKAFPFIMNKRSSQNPIRLWVPACSSGQEAYSFAIALYEFLEERKMKPYIQVFGTDLSEALIEKARAGLYTDDISAQVSAERLRRFFVKTETGYKIVKHIRDLCIFSKHDIVGNPPLSNMDIVSCRNLLIYLDTFLQNKALSILHYALKPKGFLVLGTAESITAAANLFTAIDKKQKIYSKNRLLGVTTAAAERPVTVFAAAEAYKAKKEDPSKQSLVTPLMAALLKEAKIAKHYDPKAAGSDKIIIGNAQMDVARLRKEFTRTAENLKALSEEKDTFNEELKAANEEIQSSNEELQSMNEELETSKEEIQSTNEELLTTNEELQNKNIELTHANDDLSNVFSSTNIPIIIVGNDLRIKRFTPMARKVMNLIPTDVERPIGDIKLNIDIVNLEELILSVIEDMAQKELEAKDKDGRWYSVRIRPYRTLDNKIDGAVITMVDIDAIKRSREEVQGALNYSQAIIETMKEPLLVLDKDVRILSANKAFYDAFKTKASDVEHKSLYKLDRNQWDVPQLRKLLEQVLSKQTSFNDFEALFDVPKVGRKTMILNGRPIKMSGEKQPMILLVIEDITMRKKADEILKRDSKDLKKIVKKKSMELLDLGTKMERAKYLSGVGTLAATISHELRNTLAAINLAAYNIRKKNTNPELEGSLSNIDKMVLEGDHIINNVLSYSKIKMAHFEEVEINDILRSCLDEIEAHVLDRAISILSSIDLTDNLFIDGDFTQLKEVFSNILNNALDAVINKDGVIEVASEIKDSRVSILIRDNGEGIPKEDLGKILSPFFTTKAKGTGLGLAVCNQIVMLHNGSIDIESSIGKGTKVEVTLPIHRNKHA